MISPRCHRGNCHKRGRSFNVTIPIVIPHEEFMHPFGVRGHSAGGGAVRTKVVLCRRHEDRVRRFTRWELKP